MLSLTPRWLEGSAELGRGLMLRRSGGGLLIVDADLRILLIDGEAHLDPDLVGRCMPDVFPEDAWKILEPRYREALGGEAEPSYRDMVGEPSVQRLRMTPIRDDGAVVGVMVLSADAVSAVTSGHALASGGSHQQSVLDLLDEGVIVLDPHGRLLQANHAAGVILGFNPEADLIAWGAYREGTNSDIWATVLRTGRAMQGTPLEVDRPDGTRVSLQVSCSPLRDRDGTISGLVQSLRNVSEQTHEHRRLAATQDRLREAHEVARLSSWEWAPATGVVSVFHALPDEKSSPGTRATLDELLEETPPGERQGARDDLESIARGESEGSVRRSRREYPAGSAWLETRTRAVRDGDGALLCVRGTTQDVTEQELSGQETVRARDFLQATLDSLAAHIAVLDDAGEILLTNRAWADFAAANGSGPIGLGENYLAACDAAVGDESAARVAAGLRAILSGSEGEFSMEYPCHSPTVERWYVVRIARFDGHGDARVVVSHDD